LKNHRKTKEDEYFIILKKLASVKNFESLKRKDFERPKIVKKSFRGEIEKPQDEFIPHSTLISRLEELKKMNMVEDYDSGERSKKNLPIKEYSMTFLGAVKLYQLCKDEKLLLDVWDLMPRFSYLLMYKHPLESVFTKEQLTDTLSYVCKNIVIDIVTDTHNMEFKPGRIPGLTAYDELKGKLSVKIYFVEITVNFPSFSHTIIERIPIYAKKIDRKIQFLDVQAIDIINKIITCVFLHELFIRSSLLEYVQLEYPNKKGRNHIMHILKQDKELNIVYKDFLKKIESDRRFEEKTINEIKEYFKWKNNS